MKDAGHRLATTSRSWRATASTATTPRLERRGLLVADQKTTCLKCHAETRPRRRRAARASTRAFAQGRVHQVPQPAQVGLPKAAAGQGARPLLRLPQGGQGPAGLRGGRTQPAGRLPRLPQAARLGRRPGSCAEPVRRSASQCHDAKAEDFRTAHLGIDPKAHGLHELPRRRTPRRIRKFFKAERPPAVRGARSATAATQPEEVGARCRSDHCASLIAARSPSARPAAPARPGAPAARARRGLSRSSRSPAGGRRGKLCLDCHGGLRGEAQDAPSSTRRSRPATAPAATTRTPPTTASCSPPSAGDGLPRPATPSIVPPRRRARTSRWRSGSCTACHDPHASRQQVQPGEGRQRAVRHAATSRLVEAAAKAKFKHTPVLEGLHRLPRPARLGQGRGAPQERRARSSASAATSWTPPSSRRQHLDYPVAKAHCTSCHDPHGSDKRGML